LLTKKIANNNSLKQRDSYFLFIFILLKVMQAIEHIAVVKRQKSIANFRGHALVKLFKS
jgi:hypothetical protein